jgi:hypothetical protein
MTKHSSLPHILAQHENAHVPKFTFTGLSSHCDNILALHKYSCGFPQSLQLNVGTVPQLGHDHFLPNYFKSTIHQGLTVQSSTD